MVFSHDSHEPHGVGPPAQLAMVPDSDCQASSKCGSPSCQRTFNVVVPPAPSAS